MWFLALPILAFAFAANANPAEVPANTGTQEEVVQEVGPDSLPMAISGGKFSLDGKRITPGKALLTMGREDASKPYARRSWAFLIGGATGIATGSTLVVAAIEEEMPILVAPAVGSAVLGFVLLRPYAKNMVAGAGAYNAAVAPTEDGVSLMLEGTF